MTDKITDDLTIKIDSLYNINETINKMKSIVWKSPQMFDVIDTLKDLRLKLAYEIFVESRT